MLLFFNKILKKLYIYILIFHNPKWPLNKSQTIYDFFTQQQFPLPFSCCYFCFLFFLFIPFYNSIPQQKCFCKIFFKKKKKFTFFLFFCILLFYINSSGNTYFICLSMCVCFGTNLLYVYVITTTITVYANMFSKNICVLILQLAALFQKANI